MCFWAIWPSLNSDNIPMIFRIFLISQLLFLPSKSVFGQQMQDDFNEWVVFKVKSIDDFFERFNGERNTELNAYLRANHPEMVPDRKNWIRSVFNLENEDLRNDTLVYRFILEVTDSVQPRFLNYRDNHWYAKVECYVFDDIKLYPVTLILKVKKSADASFRWSVVSANAGFLRRADGLSVVSDTSTLSADSSQQYFLNPVSHGIDFLNLDKFFKSRTQVRNYLHQQKNNTFETEKLVKMISGGELRFNQVREIRYYMLQIKGWILEIDYFNRPGRNTGWLVNSLKKVTAAEKSDFMINELYIPMYK